MRYSFERLTHARKHAYTALFSSKYLSTVSLKWLFREDSKYLLYSQIGWAQIDRENAVFKQWEAHVLF